MMRIPPPDLHRHPDGRIRYVVRQHRGEGPMHVPAGRVQGHIDQLLSWGLHPIDIAVAARIDNTTVINHHRRRRDRIPRQYEAALLAVTFRPHPRQAHVLTIGARRRAFAMTAIGWSLPWQADRVGLTAARLRAVLARPRMLADLHAAIADLYREVGSTAGPSARAVAWARKRATPGPWSWDDDTIDDPRAEPIRCERSTGRTVVHLEDVRWLREQAALGPDAIATRLGIATDTVKDHLRRDQLRAAARRESELERESA